MQNPLAIPQATQQKLPALEQLVTQKTPKRDVILNIFLNCLKIAIYKRRMQTFSVDMDEKSPKKIHIALTKVCEIILDASGIDILSLDYYDNNNFSEDQKIDNIIKK